jgi:restriction system protein
MVRAGKGGRFFEDFRDRALIAVGWWGVGDLTGVESREQVADRVRRAFPTFSDPAVIVAAGQLYRFAVEFRPGDRVVTYDPRARMYLCGEIVGPYKFIQNTEQEEYLNQRSVRWLHETSRESLSQGARNTLGSTVTIFRIPPEVTSELWQESKPSTVIDEGPNADPTTAQGAAPLTFEAVQALASEAIKDQIARLDWQQMQELVAGLLRSLGYKTVVSPPGSDRGRDIVASPDGFGFRDPRVVVEVKHRLTQRMGSQEIRSFLGGRQQGDKGLYVSTGGFTRDAYYEAERANIPLTLMDFEMLVESILDNYGSFDEATKQILPLTKVFWPVAT